MPDSNVKITIPEDMIKGIVLAEMSKALGDKEELMRSVVAAAMSRKKNNYDRHTVFESMVGDSIRNAAMEAFKEWMDQNKDKIKAALLAHLNKAKQKRLREMVEQMVDPNGIKFRCFANLDLRMPDDE